MSKYTLKENICASQQIECQFWEKAYQNPGKVKGYEDHFFLDVGDNWSVFVSKTTDILAYNRTYSRSGNAPLSKADLQHIIDIYKKYKVPRFFLSLTPMEEDRYQNIIEASGFTRYNQWVKLYRSLENYSMLPEDNRIMPVGENEYKTFADIMRLGFDEPEKLNFLNTSIPSVQGTHSYLAWIAGRPGAAAVLFSEGDWSQLVMAATLEWARGKGLQKALIAQRMNQAKLQGSKWICVETSDDKPDKIDISKANMTKMGFEVLFKRTNFLHVLTCLP